MSSCESLTWDFYNERKCELSETREMSEDLTDDNDEKSSIVSIFNSPSDEKEESLEDVFQTITPTSPTQTQPISLSLSIQSIQCNPIPLPSSMLQSAVPLSRVAPLHTQSIDANIRNQIDCTRGWPHQDALHLLHGH